MRALFTIAAKDLRLLLRQRLDAFFVFVFPVLFAAFFTQVLSGSASGATRIKVAVVDEAQTEASIALSTGLLDDPGLRAERRTRVEAIRDVREGKRAAYVLFEPGAARQVVLGVDPARSGETGLLTGALLRISGAQMTSLLPPPGSPARAALPGAPLTIQETQVAGGVQRAPQPGAVTLPQGLAWGLMACAAAFGTSLVSERRRGTLVRLRTAPIPPLLLLAGKGLACFVAEVLVCALLLGAAGPLFGIEPTSWPLLIVAALSAAACFVGLMTLVGVLGQSEETTFRVSWAGLLVLAMLGGAMVPTYLFPAWLEQAGSLSPVRWTILALEGALWRGLSPRAMLAPCGALLGTGALAFTAAALVFTRRS